MKDKNTLIFFYADNQNKNPKANLGIFVYEKLIKNKVTIHSWYFDNF